MSPGRALVITLSAFFLTVHIATGDWVRAAIWAVILVLWVTGGPQK